MNKLNNIYELIKNNELDEFTKNKLLLIKNEDFKKNVFDINNKMIVSQFI